MCCYNYCALIYEEDLIIKLVKKLTIPGEYTSPKVVLYNSFGRHAMDVL